MLKENINDLYTFMIVAQEMGFTKAANKLGVTQSALSHSIKSLERRLGFQLLNRTTRSISLTPQGKKIFNNISPRFSEIEHNLNSLGSSSDNPTGYLRLAVSECAAYQFLWPVLVTFLPQHPNVKIEIDIINTAITNNLNECDAVIDIGELLTPGRVTEKLSDDLELAIVASPNYFDVNGIPVDPTDLYAHRCIGLKQWQTHNVFWQFKNGINQALQLDLPFSLLFNTYSQLKQAVLAHAGIAYIPKILIQEELENRQIMAILTDRCISLPGFYIHYLERMKDNDILSLLITALYQYGQQLRRN